MGKVWIKAALTASAAASGSREYRRVVARGHAFPDHALARGAEYSGLDRSVYVPSAPADMKPPSTGMATPVI
jgi:hypothetical protein